MDGKRSLILGLAVGAALAGCTRGGGDPLAQQRFTGHTSPTDSIAAPVDRAGPVLYNQVRVNFMEPTPQVEGLGMADDAPIDPAVQDVSATVQQEVRSPTEVAAEQPTTRPVAQPQTPATDPADTAEPAAYYTIGGVVAKVNGQPIFANRVLGILARPLQARAQELDRQPFEAEARELIARQIWELTRAELEFAAAQRYLTPEDRLLADAMTMNWRNRRITEAGGSLQQAIQVAYTAGEDFDIQLEEQYRTFMTQVYYQKRIIPRVQVTAEDLRAYYDRHLQDQFTEFDQARFRVIKIDPTKMESVGAAQDRIATMRRQVEAGTADFATLASQINHDSYLMSRGGDVGTIQRGAYVVPQLEEAVWKTPVGGVTEVVEARGAYYIAKVEEKQEGRVRAFEDEQVQDAIRNTLRAEQFRALRERYLQQLQETAIIRIDPAMIEIAVEMAVQNYPRWRKGG